MSDINVSSWHNVPYEVEMAIRADERRRLKYKFGKRIEWLKLQGRLSAAFSVQSACTALIRDPMDRKSVYNEETKDDRSNTQG